jgi:hypothetical protein
MMIALRSSTEITASTRRLTVKGLQELLTKRVDQLTKDGGDDVSEFAHFLVVRPGDTPSDVETELGFPILTNLVDGVRFGDPEFEPSWEWIMRHEGWFELVYVLSDDGFGWVVFVQDDEATDADLLAVCREYAPAT